jgi:hypothetical protein
MKSVAAATATAAATTVSAFSANENKALLWSVLHGGGKFVGISESQVPAIKEIFEQTIHSMSEHCRRLNQPVNLNAINKEAVVIICNKIEAIKMQQSQQQSQQQIYQRKQQQVPQLETIYRAEDLQKERQNAFQNEFKRKEEEMSSVLKLKKPEEINFTDDVYDKPIGDDMERLLAEALASRERELEQIKNVTFHAHESDSSHVGSNSSKTKEQFVTYKVTNAHAEKAKSVYEKRVSFGNELHIIENENENEVCENDYNENNENNENDENNGDVSFIFNKLKKIKTRKNLINENENIANEYNASNAETILQMSQDIRYIKTTLAELLIKLNNL